MITSKVTTKSQTTLPRSVRSALKLKPGDAVRYDIDGSRVILTRVEASTEENPFGTFGEWDSEEDRRAYADL